jgi:hypothetical protein
VDRFLRHPDLKARSVTLDQDANHPAMRRCDRSPGVPATCPDTPVTGRYSGSLTVTSRRPVTCERAVDPLSSATF